MDNRVRIDRRTAEWVDLEMQMGWRLFRISGSTEKPENLARHHVLAIGDSSCPTI